MRARGLIAGGLFLVRFFNQEMMPVGSDTHHSFAAAENPHCARRF